MRRFWQSRWRDSILLIPLWVACWFEYGWLLSVKFFDEHFGYLSLLTNLEEIFGYIGVLFAVQIPVFILLLEKMHSSGYVRRLVLPSVINFREIIVSYVVLSLLLLMAPSATYFYFPVLALTGLSLYAVVEAVRVMFEARKLKSRESAYIKKLVERALSASLKGRINNNIFFDTFSKYPYITHSLADLGYDYKESDKYYTIRINRSGIVKSIDIKKLYNLMSSKYYSDVPKVTAGKAKDTTPLEQHARLVVLVRPESTVQKQDEVIKLILEEGTERPSRRFMSSLVDSIKTSYDHPDSADKQMDDIIKDFKQQIRSAIDKDDVVAIDDALEVYELLSAGLATLYSSEDNSSYDLEMARKEFNQVFGDSVSDRLRLIAEVIVEEFEYAIRTGHQEAVKNLASSMYRSIIYATELFDVLTVARAEKAFVAAIATLIYSDEVALPDMNYRVHVLEMLTPRLKEHTSLLLYNYREYNDSMSFNKKQLVQWIEMRLSDIRSLMMGSYEKSYFKMFNELKDVLDVIEDDYDLYRKQVEEFALLVRCMLFVVAAYMHSREENDEQKKMRELLDNHFKTFSASELTGILVRCVDEKYAYKWRVDVYDLVMDGKMHSVPDFNIKLKSLWTEYMLALTNIPENLRYYDGIPLAKTDAFTDQLPDARNAFLTQHLDSLAQKGDDVATLENLIKKFTAERLKWEHETLARAELDNDMVDKFKDEVTKGYKESTLALSIFRPAKHLKFVAKAPKDSFSYGWNHIQDKYGFVKGWHIGVGYQTHEYGNKIARTENKHILETLLANPTQKLDDFEVWIEKLRSNKKQWFIVSVGVAEWNIRIHRADIVKHLQGGPASNEMIFKNIDQLGPVYYTHMDSLPKGFYAVKADDIGVLKIQGTEKWPVEISIDAYSHNKALLKALTKSPPTWLSKKGNAIEQVTFLKTQVRLLIQHRFKYEPAVNPTVHFYPVTDKDGS